VAVITPPNLGATPSRGSRAVEAPTKSAKPVKYWAIVGGFFLVLQLYVYGSWLLSDDFTRTPTGADAVPGYMSAFITAMQILAPIGFVAFLWFFLIRPWRRDGRIGLDGLMCLCALGVWWQDPLVNYTQAFATYNTGYFNMGSWTEQIPGWMSPNGSKFAEPLLWTGPAYVWGMFGGVLVANKFMEWVKARRPQTGTLGMILSALAFFVFFDALFESIFMRLGVYTYPGAHDQISIGGGHYYQFPIYEALIWGATWAGFACVRYFRNDRGETVAERGIDEVQATPRQKTFIRFLALLGIWSVIFMSYNIVWAWISLNQSDWPKDITERSYFTSQICGDDTDYICPGPDQPIPRPDSGHVGPGGVYVPAG